MKLLLFLLLAGRGLPAADLPKETKQPLTGTWNIIAAEYQGKPIPQQFLKDLKMKVTIAAGKITLAYFWDRPHTEEIHFRLDPAQKPAWISGVGFEEKERSVPGIYRLDGDKLTVCFDLAAKPERPREFKSAASTERVVVTLQRPKPRSAKKGGKP
jgi:uncharacterized protein (TIGR03067 family)